MVDLMVEHHQEHFSRYKHGLSIKDYYSALLTVIEEHEMKPPLNLHSLMMDGDHADKNNVMYYNWEAESKEAEFKNAKSKEAESKNVKSKKAKTMEAKNEKK